MHTRRVFRSESRSTAIWKKLSSMCALVWTNIFYVGFLRPWKRGWAILPKAWECRQASVKDPSDVKILSCRVSIELQFCILTGEVATSTPSWPRHGLFLLFKEKTLLCHKSQMVYDYSSAHYPLGGRRWEEKRWESSPWGEHISGIPTSGPP